MATHTITRAHTTPIPIPGLKNGLEASSLHAGRVQGAMRMSASPTACLRRGV